MRKFAYARVFANLLLARETNHGSIGTGLILLLIGLFVLFRYGLTRQPLYFQQFNPGKNLFPSGQGV
jgi:hypothetical protein